MSPEPAPRVPLPLRRRALYGLLAPLLALVLLEGLARLLLSPRDLVLNEDLFFLRDDPELLWSLRPDLDVEMPEGWRLRTNGLGLRDEELPVEPPAGELRLLSLGESSAWGYGVNAEQTYAELLEGWLETRAAGGAQVVNAAVGAWSVVQSAEYLRIRGFALRPRVVMIYHLANDQLPSGVTDRRNFLYQVSDTDRALMEKRRSIAPILRVAYRSSLYLGLRARLTRPPPASDVGPVRPARGASVRVPEADRAAALASLLRSCQAVGATLMVIVPTYGGNRYAQDPLLRRFARENGLPLVDLPTLRQAAGVPDQGFFQVDGVHPTASGHRFIAEAVADELARMGL